MQPVAGVKPLGEAAFDQLASEYDASFTGTPLGGALRALVWSRFDAAFASAQRVLDLGCGTGEDAIRLACRGTRVLAVDASPLMLRVAQEKARRSGCVDRIEFRCLPLERLAGTLAGERFDGVLSNFGALNCVASLPVMLGELATKLESGAHFVFVLMGRYVPWEWLWYLMRADSARAWRRLRGPVLWRGLRVVYPTPAEVAAILQPFYRVEGVRPLGFALPPSYAAAWLNRRPRLLRGLTRAERLAQRFPSLASCADHYIIEGTRLPTG
jgi:SAM-dependent methyltransferase